MATTPDQPTALYRLFDKDDTLLYVGIAQEPRVRFRQHEAEKSWWPRVMTREITWFQSRDEALDEELLAIRKEHPVFNDCGVQWPHHQLGEAPARILSVSDIRYRPLDVLDEVASTKQPVVITRYKMPLVVIVPYFDNAPAE